MALRYGRLAENRLLAVLNLREKSYEQIKTLRNATTSKGHHFRWI